MDPRAEKGRMESFTSAAADSGFTCWFRTCIFLNRTCQFFHGASNWRVFDVAYDMHYICLNMEFCFIPNLSGVRIYVFGHCQHLVLCSLVHTWVVLPRE